MKRLVRVLSRIFAISVALATSVGVFVPASAQAAAAPWNVNMGAESTDQAIQLAYFYPNDITIDQGDTITFHYNAGEPHSAIISRANDPTHTTLYDSGLAIKGAPDGKFTFNTTGNFRLQCGLHTTMHGTVHVQARGTAYPKSQGAYDFQSSVQQKQQLAEGLALKAKALAGMAQAGATTNVTAGIDAVHTMGAVFVMRFLKNTLNVKVGDTVTFTNMSEEAPHTITANEPDTFDPTQPDNLDGPSHATLKSPQDRVNSGFMFRNPPPPSVFPFPFPPVFQVKFTQPGTYNYYCAHS